MTTRFGQTVISIFDVWEDAREFLSAIVESDATPEEEKKLLVNQSLLGGSEDWHHLIDCARSIQRSQIECQSDIDGGDILTYIGSILRAWDDDDVYQVPEPWKETDRLISLAKDLEEDVEISPPSFPTRQSEQRDHSRRPRKTKSTPGITSHYWTDKPSPHRTRRTDHSLGTGEPVEPLRSCSPCPLGLLHLENPSRHAGTAVTSVTSETEFLGLLSQPKYFRLQALGEVDVFNEAATKLTSRKRRLSESPYFLPPVSLDAESPRKRRPAGVVSCIPFPPLNALSFGIIQEKLAHEPFWLLIAITFLIKTNGQFAIPVFNKVKDRFPTPSHLIEPCNEEELLGMIRHLGLANNRLAFIRRYARGFMDQPPRGGVRYRVRNYDMRDISPPLSNMDDSPESFGKTPLTPDGESQDMEAWEIGHMTKGKYAIDSWRIFCRDELLGRAEDWKGKGREPQFQPEWMRVRPDDKELRACLRWMWMREGWEWDPVTGDRTVLREEMQRAVNESRVEYDDTGALKILDKPRHDIFKSE